MTLPVSISKLDNLRHQSLSDNSKLTRLNPDSLPKKLKILNLAASGVSYENLIEIKSKFPRIKVN